MNLRMLTIGFCLAGLIAASAANSQQPDDQQPPDIRPTLPAEKKQITEKAADNATLKPVRKTVMFPLEHVLADDLLKSIREMVISDDAGPMQIAADATTNSIIVKASSDAVKQIEDLINALESAAATEDSQQVLRVFSLGAVDAATCADVIQSVFADHDQIRIAFDQRANTLIVHAPRRQLDEIADLVEKLGEHPQGGREPEIKVFHLRYMKAGESLQEILSMLCDAEGARFALDERTNSVIVTGPVGTLNVVEVLIEHLDQPTPPDGSPPAAPASANVSLQVRVVWLISGLEQEGGRSPGDELAPVVAELAKIGFTDAKVVSNVLINALPNSHFELTGVTEIDTPCEVAISGILQTQPGQEARGFDHALMEIEIRATANHPTSGARGGFMQENLCNLNTSIAAPLGHSVVLGVSPLKKNMTSAFVVQVLAPSAPPARGNLPVRSIKKPTKR